MAFPVGFSCNAALTFDKTKVPSDLTDFPALFTVANLPSLMFDADGSDPALNGGGDIRFSSDSAGATQLACEVVSFVTNNTPASGSAEIWVKIPSLSSSTNTVIYVWWGKSGETQPAASDTYGSDNVWSSDHKLVSHLYDKTTSTVDDSTSNSYDGTKASANNPLSGTGQIGNGQVFDNSNNDYVNFGNLAALDAQSAFTASIWGKQTTGVDWTTMFGKWDSATNGWGFGTSGASLGDNNDILILLRGGSNTYAYTTGNIVDGNFHLWTMVFNGAGAANADRLKFYKDATEISLTFVGTIPTAPSSNTRNVVVGRNEPDGRYFIGSLDEVRFSNVAKSSAWITASYNNQSAPSTFATAGTPTVDLDEWGRKCAITIDHTKVNADATDFPMLLVAGNFPSEAMDKDGSYPALDGGGDLRFTSDEAGTTRIPCEVVSFVTNNNPASATAEVYVKIASLSSSTDTVIWVWYNKAGKAQPPVTDTYGRNAVWESNYKAVLHMTDGTTTIIYDSTSNGNNGTKASADNPNTDTGKVGSAQYFSGSSTDYLTLPNDCLDAIGSGSVQTWFKTYDATNYQLFGSGYTAGTPWLIFGWLAASGRTYFQYYAVDAYTVTTAISANTWGHMCWKSSGSAWAGYVNGGSAETLISLGGSNSGKWFDDVSTNTTTNYLGRTPYGGYYLKGWLDEWRLSTTQFSEQRNNTDYQNQNAPTTFSAPGTPETPGGDTPTTTITIILNNLSLLGVG